MKKIAIIPARGNSKRLPGKNIKLLCGKPMIAYAIEEAKKSKYIDDVFVTSDDVEILSISERCGANTIKRPGELAYDNTPTIEVVRHAVNHLGFKMAVVLLQPTSPLRTVKDIDRCIRLYDTGLFNTVVTVKEVAPYTFYPNGAVYVFTGDIWTDNMGMVLMKEKDSIDIDTQIDFEIAEKMLNDRSKQEKN